VTGLIVVREETLRREAPKVNDPGEKRRGPYRNLLRRRKMTWTPAESLASFASGEKRAT